jgi:hypothetical protein
MDAFRKLVSESAKDTGFLRSRWSVEVNSPMPAQTVKNPGSSGHADASYPAITPKWGDRIFIYNNTEYAIYLEYGTPLMRAQPMVEPTYVLVLSEANRLAKALSNKRVAE